MRLFRYITDCLEDGHMIPVTILFSAVIIAVMIVAVIYGPTENDNKRRSRAAICTERGGAFITTTGDHVTPQRAICARIETIDLGKMQ